MYGTASRYRSWLLVEQPGPWGHDALVESDLTGSIGEALRDRGRALGVRVLLIKQRARPRVGRRLCYAAYTGVRERRIASFEIDDPRALLHFDLRSLTGRPDPGMGEATSGPLFLVCTHGKHDACCARHGAPLYRALSDLPHGTTWECTHVGGDRFAGNLLCLPHGMYFGRVEPDAAPAVASAYAKGLVDLEHYRGRSCYSPTVQAAEFYLRRHLSITGVDDLTVTRHEILGGARRRVAFEVAPDASQHVVELEVVGQGERLLTCKSTRPHRPRSFTLVGVD
jgi:hypothetical protein